MILICPSVTYLNGMILGLRYHLFLIFCFYINHTGYTVNSTIVLGQEIIIKDDILQEEVNIGSLLSKLTNELDMHYKNKLLSISSGKYDGIYSRRFNALGKAKGKMLVKVSQDFLYQ